MHSKRLAYGENTLSDLKRKHSSVSYKLDDTEQLIEPRSALVSWVTYQESRAQVSPYPH
jgi:hypothetical protein